MFWEFKYNPPLEKLTPTKKKGKKNPLNHSPYSMTIYMPAEHYGLENAAACKEGSPFCLALARRNMPF